MKTTNKIATNPGQSAVPATMANCVAGCVQEHLARLMSSYLAVRLAATPNSSSDPSLVGRITGKIQAVPAIDANCVVGSNIRS